MKGSPEPGADPVEPELRADGYRLLSQLFLGELTASNVEILRFLPGLSTATCPDGADPLPASYEPGALDELAAEHHRVFGTEVPPYASLFLESGRRLGGATTQWVERCRLAVGLPPTHSETADHLGRELELMAALHDAAVEEPGGPWTDASHQFLDEHLLQWLPPLVDSVLQVESVSWAAVSRLTLDLVIDDWRNLGEAASPSPLPSPPQAAADTGDAGGAVPAWGDRGWATHLADPTVCGGFLSPHELRALGRAHELPSGFGGRTRLLETLLESASAYTAEGVLPEALAALMDRRCQSLLELSAAHGVPDRFVGHWADQLASTGTNLRSG